MVVYARELGLEFGGVGAATGLAKTLIFPIIWNL